MKLSDSIGGWWHSIVVSTWRAFAFFAILGTGAFTYLWVIGEFDDKTVSELVYEFVATAGLLSLGAFITSLIYHWQVQRNHIWPGGGGRKKQ